MEKDRKLTVTHIPEDPHLELSEVLKFYLMSLVPKGRLTREQDIEQYLATKFGVSHVSFKRPINLDNDYWYRIIDRVPFHRLVSSYGYAEGNDYKKLLD